MDSELYVEELYPWALELLINGDGFGGHGPRTGLTDIQQAKRRKDDLEAYRSEVIVR